MAENTTNPGRSDGESQRDRRKADEALRKLEVQRDAFRQDRMLHAWTVGGAERFGEDGGAAADRSAQERKADPRCADLVDAVFRGLTGESYLRGGFTSDAAARKMGMDITHGLVGGAASVRLIADIRLLHGCERGMLAHVGCGHEGIERGDAGFTMWIYSAGLDPVPATPLTLVQAEIAVGVRDFDGEYAGEFGVLGELERAEGGAA